MIRRSRNSPTPPAVAPAVLTAVGYRLFRTEGSTTSAAGADVVHLLPKNAQIAAVAVSGDRIIVTVEVGGAREIHTFDSKTLRATGRLRFGLEP